MIITMRERAHKGWTLRRIWSREPGQRHTIYLSCPCRSFLTEMSNGRHNNSPFKNCSPNHHKFITPPISLIDYLYLLPHLFEKVQCTDITPTITIDSDSYWFIFNLAYFRFFICRVPRVETTRHKRGRCLRQFEPQRGHKVNHWTCTGSWTSNTTPICSTK